MFLYLTALKKENRFIMSTHHEMILLFSNITHQTQESKHLTDISLNLLPLI